MFCYKCGTEMPEDSHFSRKYGRALSAATVSTPSAHVSSEAGAITHVPVQPPQQERAGGTPKFGYLVGGMPMATVFLMVCLLAVLLAPGLAAGKDAQPEVQPETLKADEIMARVAANQDHSEALRKEYVYKQHIHIVTYKPKSGMMREENADYDVVSMPNGIQKQLKLLTGRYWNKGKYVDFEGEPAPGAGRTEADWIRNLRNHEPAPMTSITDADLIRYLRNYLLDDKSKDGLVRALFPLTFEEQKDYAFKLLGQEVEAGRKVYHIAFYPKDKNELGWAGEAFIDAAEFQPVRVFTEMSRRVPLLVRTMWFDLPGLGFNVFYQRQEDGVWFPSIFGTEFRMRVGPVFFFNRNIAISVKNSGFVHTHVETK